MFVVFKDLSKKKSNSQSLACCKLFGLDGASEQRGLKANNGGIHVRFQESFPIELEHRVECQATLLLLFSCLN